MSKAEIISELPKLGLAERREIFERICELEERDLIKGDEPAADEKELLDREIADYQKNPGVGSSWSEVEARLRR
jgi:hypothetical protein